MEYSYGEHLYTLGATGLELRGDCYFPSRQAANAKMYSIMKKKGLYVNKVYDDHHFKTYICNDGITFYVNRV